MIFILFESEWELNFQNIRRDIQIAAKCLVGGRVEWKLCVYWSFQWVIPL